MLMKKLIRFKIYTQMFLFINPPGFPHFFHRKFTDLMMNCKHNESTYAYSIFGDDGACKYQMMVDFRKDSISKKPYFKAYIIYNPKNMLYTDVHTDYDHVVGLFSGLTRSPYKNKRFDVARLYSDRLVNGFVSLDGPLPETIMDDYPSLVAELDKFFKIAEQPSTSTSTEPQTSPLYPVPTLDIFGMID
jgi:hypothetical protein